MCHLLVFKTIFVAFPGRNSVAKWKGAELNTLELDLGPECILKLTCDLGEVTLPMLKFNFNLL